MEQKVIPVIRHATLRDADLLAVLGARTFHDTFAADNKPEDMAAYLANAFSTEQLSAELSDAQSTFLIAQLDGVTAGYAQLRAGDAPACVTDQGAIQLVRLYASKEWLGRGVGEALMRACVDEARASGHRTIWLGVWEKNGRAQAFYRKWDFRVVGEQIFQLGSDTQTDLLMERAL